VPSWNELVDELAAKGKDQAAADAWLNNKTQESLNTVSARREGRNVILYASAFLQKPQLPPINLQLSPEEVNGFMTVLHGMDFRRGLTLILHTPGGITNAAESVVAYLHQKFDYLEVIVPTFAMSAGTMVALGANRILMGRQSQLGPIDPQMPLPNGRTVSARAIVEQFDRAKRELLEDLRLAHLWAPIVQSLGPGLLVEAQNALDYSETMVSRWLESRMFFGRDNAADLAASIASYFNKAEAHKSHGRRIDRQEARAQGLVVEDLEGDQELQEAALTAYHLIMIVFEKSPATKVLVSNQRKQWVKNFSAAPGLVRLPPGIIPQAQYHQL